MALRCPPTLRVGLLTLVLCAPVRAQVPPEKMVADTAFEDGKVLFDSGQYGPACARFAESQRLDPATSTLLWLGECLEKIGKLASAWTTYREAAALAIQQGKTARANAALERAQALDQRRPRLLLAVTASVPSLVVRLDGVSLRPPLWNTPLPLDSGLHLIEVSAPGRSAITVSVEVTQDVAVQRVELPMPTPLDPAPAAVVPASSVAPSAPTTTTGASAARSFAWSPTAWLLGGVGLGLAASGAVLQLGARDKAQEAIALRDSSLYDRARTQQTVAIVALTAGGALLTSGLLVGWLITPDTSRPVARPWPLPVPLPGGGAVVMRGSF